MLTITVSRCAVQNVQPGGVASEQRPAGSKKKKTASFHLGLPTSDGRLHHSSAISNGSLLKGQLLANLASSPRRLRNIIASFCSHLRLFILSFLIPHLSSQP